MENIKKAFFSVLLFSTSMFFCCEDKAVVLTEETIKKIGEIAGPSTALQSIMVISAATQLLPISKDIYQSIFPTAEQQASTSMANKKLKVLKAREDFSNCLFASNIDSERGTLRCPVKCKELARIFVSVGGKNEMIEMINDFDEFWK